MLLEGVGSPGEAEVRTEPELRAAFAHWLTTVDQPTFGAGYLSRLGLDVSAIAADLAQAVLDGVRDNARGSG